MIPGAPKPSAEDIAAADRLAAVFAGHSDEEVEAVLPILFLGVARGMPDVELPSPALDRVGRFVVEDLGLSPSSSPDEMLTALAAHLKEARTPLLVALERYFREENARGGDGAVARAFSTFVGAAQQRVLDSGARPTGTIPAGPLARFLVVPPKKKP